MKRAAMVVVLVPVVLPFLAVPTWLIAAGGLASAMLFGVGVRWTSIPFVTAGATVALMVYTLVLRLAARPPDVLTATALGLALVLVLEIVDFERRTGGAGVDPAVVRSQARHWAGRVLAGAAACLGLTAGATVIRLALSPAAAPLAAAAGILAAFGAAVWALSRETTEVSAP